MRNLKFTIKESGDALITDLQRVNPKLLVVLGHFLQWCEDAEKRCHITNILSTFPESISTSHKEGRAVDISVSSWNALDLQLCKEDMKKAVGHLGAYSSSDLKQRVFVLHDAGRGKHIHLQVHR